MRQFKQYLCLENEQDWIENLGDFGSFGYFWYEGGIIEKIPTRFPAWFKKEPKYCLPGFCSTYNPSSKEEMLTAIDDYIQDLQQFRKEIEVL